MYRKLAIATIAAVYLLIWVGGVVRASGAGMGCPDWPKCFGSWVPPTNVDQLPVDYQEIYGAKLKGEVEFNVVKTWTEYVNRLVGVAIGILIFATMISAIRTYKATKPRIVFYSVLSFVFVVFEGWLGSKVVSTELHPVLVTVHMVLALVIVMFLIYALFLSEDFGAIPGIDRSKGLLLTIGLVLSFGQLILGTQVREGIDEAYLAGMPRAGWIETLGGQYYLHIALAVLVVLINVILYRSLKEVLSGEPMLKWLLGLVVLEFVIGLILGLAGMPAVGQPFHLTIATLVIGIQFFLLMKVRLASNVG